MAKVRKKRRSFGAIRQLGSGRYQASYQDTYGNRFTAPETFISYEHADLFLAQKQVDINKRLFIDPRKGKITLREWWLQYSESRKDWEITTRFTNEQTANYVLAKYPDICLADLQLNEITPYAVLKWWNNTQQATEQKALARRNPEKSEGINARIWARKNKIAVGERGRPPKKILKLWQAAGSPTYSELSNKDYFTKAGKTRAHQCYRLLRQLFIAAVELELIHKNPANIKSAKQEKPRERIPATNEQVAELALLVPKRYQAAVRVAAYSGLRQGELFALQRKDYDSSTRKITVNKSKKEVSGVITIGAPKTKASNRSVTLPPKIAQELEQHLETYTKQSPTALIFATKQGNYVSKTTLFHIWNRARQQLNLEYLSWHDLRHTGQSEAAKAGANSKELMARQGHADAKTSLIYTHADPEADQNLSLAMNKNIIDLDKYRSA
jgi:integrase